MITSSRLWLAALALGACPLAASANGYLLPPMKVDFSFKFRVYNPQTPHPTAPWWAYFPDGGQTMTPQSGTHFPNWPQQPPLVQPVAAPRQPTPGPNIAPNIVSDYVPGSVLPAGYYAPPSYWYSR